MQNARLYHMHSEALAAARAGRPLPAGYKLPHISEETQQIYDAIRDGESMESISMVRTVCERVRECAVYLEVLLNALPYMHTAVQQDEGDDHDVPDSSA